MKIVDLPDEKKELFCLCLEDWSAEALAVDDHGVEGGMIQYGPIERSHVDGTGLYFVHCIHVHGYKQGRGNFQRRGMGQALLAAAEQDARQLGAQGMAAWGVWLRFCFGNLSMTTRSRRAGFLGPESYPSPSPAR